MRVLLINPPLREQYPPNSFPYGLAYVAKYLQKAGHHVEVLDIDTFRYDRKKVVEELSKYKCDVVGTGGIITVYKYLKWLIPEIRKAHPEAKIILGGTLTTSVPELVLNNLDIDFIVIGEGEITAPNLVNYLENHKKDKKAKLKTKAGVDELKKIKGIGFRHEGKVIITEPQELIADLDSLEAPALDLFDTKKIISYLGGKMEILTERGCPFRCDFCYHQFGYKSRRRSMENVVKEMKYLSKKYDTTNFTLPDNLFVFNKNEILKLIGLFKKYDLKVTFDASMRASLVTEELIQLLQKAGCTSLCFGFESGSQKVLNLMNKMTTVEQMDRAIAIMEKHKMQYFGTFIIGYPGEKKEDIDKTIDFCVRHNHLAKPFFATPYPGTPLYERIKHKIKDMDKFVETLGDARDLVINISEFSDKELIRQRRRVTEATEKAYLKKHRFWGLVFSPLRLLNIEVGFVVYGFLHTPFIPWFRTSVKIALGYLKGKKVVPLSDEGYIKTFE
jgi:anaerobic magnesium-protoporphyrin IX monomethyl ester cyclase